MTSFQKTAEIWNNISHGNDKQRHLSSNHHPSPYGSPSRWKTSFPLFCRTQKVSTQCDIVYFTTFTHAYLCCRRINTLSQYVNKTANVYTLGHILLSATWGKYQPSNDHSKELCNPVTNKVVVIWIVGHIITTWFLLQFISCHMVSFFFHSYDVLIYSSVCVPMIGYIAWLFFYRTVTPRRSSSVPTRRDYTTLLVHTYQWILIYRQPLLLSDSLVSDTCSLLLIRFYLVPWSSSLTRSLV